MIFLPLPLRHLGIALAVVCAGSPAAAQFSAAISPPRVELDAPAGKTVRSVIEITNTSPLAGEYKVYTNDWSLTADGKINFSSELADDSCRSWVAIERKQISVPSGSRFRYRFEVSPPFDTAARECRFALMIESSEQGVESGPVNIPMSGRIGVIVYARVGDVVPDLRVVRSLVAQSDGKAVPALEVFNAGQATGRFFGFVTARLADGSVVDLSPNSVPILPGMRRTVELLPVPPADRPNDKSPELRWPLRVSGTLETGLPNGPKTPVDVSYESANN